MYIYNNNNKILSFLSKAVFYFFSLPQLNINSLQNKKDKISYKISEIKIYFDLFFVTFAIFAIFPHQRKYQKI